MSMTKSNAVLKKAQQEVGHKLLKSVKVESHFLRKLIVIYLFIHLFIYLFITIYGIQKQKRKDEMQKCPDSILKLITKSTKKLN